MILGGVNYLDAYQAAGLSRAEAIAELELYEARVWLDGIEQELMRTVWKDGQHPTFGHSVYQQRAFITQLPVGDHVSYFEETCDGSLFFSATVHLRILPRTDALCS